MRKLKKRVNCEDCIYSYKTNAHSRYFIYQCKIDGGVHKKGYHCKRGIEQKIREYEEKNNLLEMITNEQDKRRKDYLEKNGYILRS